MMRKLLLVLVVFTCFSCTGGRRGRKNRLGSSKDDFFSAQSDDDNDDNDNNDDMGPWKSNIPTGYSRPITCDYQYKIDDGEFSLFTKYTINKDGVSSCVWDFPHELLLKGKYTLKATITSGNLSSSESTTTVMITDPTATRFTVIDMNLILGVCFGVFYPVMILFIIFFIWRLIYRRRLNAKREERRRQKKAENNTEGLEMHGEGDHADSDSDSDFSIASDHWDDRVYKIITCIGRVCKCCYKVSKCCAAAAEMGEE